MNTEFWMAFLLSAVVSFSVTLMGLRHLRGRRRR